MNWVLKRNILFIVAFMAFWGCKSSYEELPPQVYYVSSLDLGNVQREKILDEILVDRNDRLRGWGNLVRATDHILLSQFLEALPYLDEAEYIFRSLETDLEGTSRVLFLKAHAYWNLGAISQKVLDYSTEAVALAPQNRWPTYAGNKSIYLAELGYYEEALALSDTLLPIYKKNNSNLSEALVVRALALNELGTSFRERDSILELAKKQVVDLGVPIDKEHVYQQLLKLGVLDVNDLLEALEFARTYDYAALEAEIRRQLPAGAIYPSNIQGEENEKLRAYQKALDRRNELNRRFLQYELERATRLAERQEKEARFRIFINAFISVVLVVLALLGLLFLRNRKDVRLAQVGAQDAQLNLDNYKSRIRPHFLFNQLNNVSGFLSQDKVLDAQEYIGLLSVHLRALLESDKSQIATVSQELDRLKNYVALQELSTYPNVKVELECDREVRFQKVPSGLLQPLVENSYKYAANAREEGAFIKVSAIKAGPKVIISVEDSGYGFLDRAPGTGTGHSLIKERIDFNKANSKTPGLWGFEAKFGKRKSTVKITVPFQHD